MLEGIIYDCWQSDDDDYYSDIKIQILKVPDFNDES